MTYLSEDRVGTYDHGGSVLGKGASVFVTLSLEVIEAYIDPDINLWAEDDRGRLWAYEACDPVEACSCRIQIGSRRLYVSNFVLRPWFDAENPPGARFDYLGRARRPFHAVEHGYAIYRRGKRELTKWGASYPAWRIQGKQHPAARTARRRR